MLTLARAQEIWNKDAEILPGKKTAKSYGEDRREERHSQLGLSNLAEFIFYAFSGHGKLFSLMC